MPSAERLVTMKPTRGYNSPGCHSTLATTWRYLFQLWAFIAEAGKIAAHLVRRSPNRALEQVPDPLLQDPVSRQSDCVADALGFEKFVDLGIGKGGVAPEVEALHASPATRDHRLQHRAPAIGAVHVARPQRAALDITKLIEHE